LAENASFGVLIDKISSIFDMFSRFCCRLRQEKKLGWVGLGREGTQSHKTLYFSYLWGGHPWADSHKIWHAPL